MPGAKQPNFRNAEKEKIHMNYFQGGSSIDTKLAVPNSFYSSQALDFRSVPSQMTVLPGPSALSTTLPDLITAMEQDLAGVRYGVGTAGNIYRIDTSNNISVIATMTENGSAGILYNQVTDQLYIPGQTSVSMYGQVTTGNAGQPAYQPNIFAQSVSTAAGTTQLFDPDTLNYDLGLRSAAAATYSVPLALSEAGVDSCPFSPDIEPGYSIQLWVVAKGTGDWTVTLHDSQNNALASVTVVNASLTNGQFNEFKFGKQVRVLVAAGGNYGAANYHFHVTSTVADGTAQVVTASDFSTANFLWYAYRLVQTNNGWHPTALFPVKTGTGTGVALCIGNGQYLTTYNFSQDNAPPNTAWVRHQLVFKTGYEVCGISTNNQYLVVAVERRSSSAGRSFQDGALYFWDGTTSQPSFVIDIPMGAPYGLQTFNNVTYFICAGSLFAWSGGQTVIKVRKLAYQNTDYLGTTDTTLVNPNAMAIRYNLLLMGYPSTTTNVNINYGVYSWGSVEVMYPNSLGYSYAPSHGFLNNNTGGISNLQIGAVYNFVDTMYMSWSYTQGGVTYYGLDLLNNSSSPAPSFAWQSLIYDGGVSYKIKEGLRYQVTFRSWPAGATLNLNYTVDGGTQQVSTITPSVGDKKIVIDLERIRFHELQWGFTGTVTGSTTPQLIGVTMEINPLVEETDMSAPLDIPL